MSVRLYVAPWKHPLDCEVCRADEQVSFSRLFTFGDQVVASPLSVLIPCPHCRDSAPLRERLTRGGGS